MSLIQTYLRYAVLTKTEKGNTAYEVHLGTYGAVPVDVFSLNIDRHTSPLIQALKTYIDTLQPVPLELDI